MYRLKENQPDFKVADGPFAGRTYGAGETYGEVPPEEANRFDVIEAIPPIDARPSGSDARSARTRDATAKKAPEAVDEAGLNT